MPQSFILETDRMRLREFGEGDVAAYYRIGSDEQVTRFTGTGQLQSPEYALEILRANPLADYRRDGFGRWACVLKSTYEVIGFAGFKRLLDLDEVDIAFWFLPAYWWLGLATEAAQATLRYGFDHLKLPRVIGLVDPAHLASIRVLEKLGMTYEGTIDYHGEPTLRYAMKRPGG